MGTRTVVVCVLLALSSVASGAIVSFDLSVEFSGATPPDGAAPWLNATFDDEDSPGSVMMTLTATNLTGAEFVSEWEFNLDPGLAPADLQFSSPIKTGSFDDPAISTSIDAFKADGAGYFDIKMDFSTGGGLNARFGAGEAVEYAITGADSLRAGSFSFLCTPADHGPFFIAAHVQNIGETGEDSGWITGIPDVPEPATLLLLAFGGLAILKRRRR